jgi:CheY-like chemotaxis protein
MDETTKPPKKILVVEDEGIVAADIQRRLIRLGFSAPEVAGTAEKALEIAAAAKPDLVLMDIVLRGETDGISAAHKIRSELDIPVIFLTAHTDTTTLQRAKIAEPFGYVVKPFAERDLEVAIEIGLYKHQAERERIRLIAQLQEALAKVKTLSGLLPICACCKKIRDDKGYWEKVELYITRHSDATFTHGYCPTCYNEMRAESGLPPRDYPKSGTGTGGGG